MNYGVFYVFSSSDCDAEGDLRSSLHRGDYAEKCPKNRSDMEIRGKQKSVGSKQVKRVQNIFFETCDV